VARLLADPYLVGGSQYLWDPLTAAIATGPGIGELRAERIDVVQAEGPAHGRTVAAANGAQVRVALHADATAFAERYLRTVTGDPRLVLQPPANHVDIAFARTIWSVNGAPRSAPGHWR